MQNSRSAACRKYSHTFVDFWRYANQSWVAALCGARDPAAGWFKARAFRVPVQLQRSGDAVPHIKLRFRGGSYGSMHGDNHCGWAITGLLLSDEAQLTPAEKNEFETTAIAVVQEAQDPTIAAAGRVCPNLNLNPLL